MVYHSLITRSYNGFLAGGGYFASLRARASSREPRASVFEPQKIPAKKSKNGHNALIWHLLHAGYIVYANTRGPFYQTAPTKSDSNDSFSKFLTWEAGQWNGLSKTEMQISVVRSKVIPNIPVRRNRNGSFICRTSTEFSGIFGTRKTPAVFMCWCTVAWQVRLWKFFPSFFISSN